MVILFCGERGRGLLFLKGDRRSGFVFPRFFALLRLLGSRRSSDPILTASSGGAFLIGDKGPFSVLTSGEGALAGVPIPLIVMRVTENSFYVLYIIKEKSPVPDTCKGYRSRV